jgi:hypothetical protein
LRAKWFLDLTAAGVASGGNRIAVSRGGGRTCLYRLSNAPFSEVIKPMMAGIKNRNLSRDEIDRGKKSGDHFWTAVADEYNKDVSFYGELAHDMQWPGAIPKPASFAGLAKVAPTKVKESYKKLTKEYDNVIAMWNQSGTHQSGLPKPIGDFTTQQIIRYFHEFVHGQPDILSIVTKGLSDDGFSESTNNNRKRKGVTVTNPRNRSAGKQDASSDTLIQLIATQGELTESRNHQAMVSSEQKMVSSIHRSLHKLQDRRRAFI